MRSQSGTYELNPVPRGPVGIIDDDVTYIRAVERMLGLEEFAAFPVTTLDVDEAARVVADARCIAVLVDVMMYDEPRGLSCVQRLRCIPAMADVPIILASGAPRQLRNISAFLATHRCIRLDKPFGPDELLATIRQALSPARHARSSVTRSSQAPIDSTVARRPDEDLFLRRLKEGVRWPATSSTLFTPPR